MKDRLKEFHLKARLARDAIASEAYGAALAAIQEGEVRENKDFDGDKILAVIEKEAGKFKESAEAFAKAEREEKAEQMSRCVSLLQELLPEKLDAAAYPKMVSEAIASVQASSMKDMGKVMARLKQEAGAALDMRLASQEVKAALQ